MRGKMERVIGIEPMLVVWDTKKEWPLPRIGRGPLKDRSWPLRVLRERPLPVAGSAPTTSYGSRFRPPN